MSNNTDPIIQQISAIDADHPHGRNHIKTKSGLYVNFLDPDPATINLDDIATGLSNIGRYGGHTWSFYSVLEHSIHVAAQLYRTYGNDALALYGLLHDSPEAYLNDVVGPLKGLLPEYQIIEGAFTHAIEKRFLLPLYSLDDPRVKDVDKAIVPWEMAMIRDCRFRQPSDPSLVKKEFIRAFHQYGGKEFGHAER